MEKRLLLIAYHFPPIQGSTGVTRTLAHAKYLQRFGWAVTVLTVDPRVYPETFSDNIHLIPPTVRVERAFALNTQKHLSIAGKYPLALAVPDPWQSWIPGGITRGMRLIKRWRPDVLMSTYPIASAHCIAWGLHRLTGIPWVAELRDPMAQDNYPTKPLLHRAFSLIERRIFKYATSVIVTTKGCAELYKRRFPRYPADAICVIPNGFDAEMFPPAGFAVPSGGSRRRLTLLHSGLLYPHERNPQALFQALSELKHEGAISSEDVLIKFRASGNEETFLRDIRRLQLEDLVEFLPAIPYTRALKEIMSADALLLLQAQNCNNQIPAKLYEYLHAGRPIIALADPHGDTAEVLTSLGIDWIVALEDKNGIKQLIVRSLEEVRAGRARLPEPENIRHFSREALTSRLAGILDAARGA